MVFFFYLQLGIWSKQPSETTSKHHIMHSELILRSAQENGSITNDPFLYCIYIVLRLHVPQYNVNTVQKWVSSYIPLIIFPVVHFAEWENFIDKFWGFQLPKHFNQKTFKDKHIKQTKFQKFPVATWCSYCFIHF